MMLYILGSLKLRKLSPLAAMVTSLPLFSSVRKSPFNVILTVYVWPDSEETTAFKLRDE